MDWQSILPDIFGKSWWEAWDYPRRIMDQFFGELLFDEDLEAPRFILGTYVRPRTQARVESSGYSEVCETEGGELRIRLQTSQFRPEEVKINVVGRFVVVHGKHEKRPTDSETTVEREFRRRYMLPNGCEADAVKATWESEEVLVITAPMKKEVVRRERSVPIADAISDALVGRGRLSPLKKGPLTVNDSSIEAVLFRKGSLLPPLYTDSEVRMAIGTKPDVPRGERFAQNEPEVPGVVPDVPVFFAEVDNFVIIVDNDDDEPGMEVSDDDDEPGMEVSDDEPAMDEPIENGPAVDMPIENEPAEEAAAEEAAAAENEPAEEAAASENEPAEEAAASENEPAEEAAAAENKPAEEAAAAENEPAEEAPAENEPAEGAPMQIGHGILSAQENRNVANLVGGMTENAAQMADEESQFPG